MKIYIDFDDVICETAKYFTKLARDLFGIVVPYQQIHFFDLQKSFALCDAQYVELMHTAHMPENLLQYAFRLNGESAGDAEIVSAEYRAQTGESGALEPDGGALLLQASADGKNVYTITLVTEVTSGGQTRQVTFTFRLSWQETQDAVLRLTWVKNSTDAQSLTCQAGKQTQAEIRRTEL